MSVNVRIGNDIIENAIAIRLEDADNAGHFINFLASESSLPKLYAPSVSVSGNTLTITDSVSNGAFTESFNVYVDGVFHASTSSTTYDLSSLSQGTASITATANATGFLESDASASATFLHSYSVNMYDDDQTTLLQTESVLYGNMPTYEPTKQGYSFEYWEDDNGNTITAITGDSNIYAVWIENKYIVAGTYQGIVYPTVDNANMDFDISMTFKARFNSATYTTCTRIGKVWMSSQWQIRATQGEGEQYQWNKQMAYYYSPATGHPYGMWHFEIMGSTEYQRIVVEENQEVTPEQKAVFDTFFTKIS